MTTAADESYPLRCEIAYQKEIVQRLENRLGRLWPLAQAAEALAVLTEAHTGIADNSPEGIIRTIKAMRETIKSLNRRAQYAEANARVTDEELIDVWRVSYDGASYVLDAPPLAPHHEEIVTKEKMHREVYEQLPEFPFSK